MKKKAVFLKIIYLCFFIVISFGVIGADVYYRSSGAEIQNNNSDSFADAVPAVTNENILGNSQTESKKVSVSFVNKNNYETLGITSEMNELIKEYFTRYFSALGSFCDIKMDDLFYFDTDYQRGLCNTMITYQNTVRRDMDVDLSYDFATVGITYKSISKVNGGYDIYLCENDFMNYSFIPDVTSYTCDVEHHFIIKEMQGSFYIVEHSEISGVYELIKEEFDAVLKRHKYTLKNMTASAINSVFEELNNDLVRQTNENLSLVRSQREEYNKNPSQFKSNLSADNTYDRKKALDYSYKWAGKLFALRNPAYTAYDIYGGNCNNYTSQCLLAGGIPMDLQGALQWKWYGEGIDNSSSRTGRSMSWASVENFYSYCRTNSGFGLVCDTQSNLYSGAPGDIIQYVSEGKGVHSVIITKVIYDSDNNVIDYLVNSNTTDKVDSPMTAYGYTQFRLIKIIGWNNN